MSPCRCTWITSTWVSEVMTVGHLVCTPNILCPRSPTSSQSDFALLIHRALQGNLQKQGLNKRWKTDILANDLQVFKLEGVTDLSLWPVLNNYIHFFLKLLHHQDGFGRVGRTSWFVPFTLLLPNSDRYLVSLFYPIYPCWILHLNICICTYNHLINDLNLSMF